MQRYETVFRSTVCKAEHPVVQVHPLTAVWAIILGSFVRRLLGVTSEASARLFAMLQDHVTRLENIVRWRWSAGDVVIWDNRAIQHKAIDDYGNEPRIERRVTIDGPVSVGIDGRHGKTRNSDGSDRDCASGGVKEHSGVARIERKRNPGSSHQHGDAAPGFRRRSAQAYASAAGD